ncbi:hypothetical protein [Streptomyces anthocyanicus]|uniref:hypothetical protein n=1 Tax=Streptomyces anthocyanicus TaxID=68174 RepID=UPI00382D7B46
MTDHEFKPGLRSRKGRAPLPPEAQAIADELSRRAAQMWADADGELSIREAVEVAAFRMGVETPQTGAEPGEVS